MGSAVVWVGGLTAGVTSEKKKTKTTQGRTGKVLTCFRFRVGRVCGRWMDGSMIGLHSLRS